MKPSKAAIKLLRASQRMLKGVPKEEFNMDTYGQTDDKGWDNLRRNKPACATAACWGGWCTTIPELQAQGLCLQADKSAVALSRKVRITCNGKYYYCAIAEAFGISESQAIYITSHRCRDREFYPITKDMVHRRINTVIAGNII